MLDELGAALFDKLPRKVQTGCMVGFAAIIVAAGIWWLIERQ